MRVAATARMIRRSISAAAAKEERQLDLLLVTAGTGGILAALACRLGGREAAKAATAARALEGGAGGGQVADRAATSVGALANQAAAVVRLLRLLRLL